MKKLLILLSTISLFFLGCAGTPKEDSGEALDNALVSFTSSVQSSRWQEALSYVTPDEARQIGTSDGYEFLPEYQTAASRLPLSTLRKAGLSVDSEGRLVGIKSVMDETNERYKVSEDQAKVIEEGQKILQEEEATAHQEQQVEVLTNRLTDDEKRKYGSTGELLAPEATRDDGTSEESYNGSYKK